MTLFYCRYDGDFQSDMKEGYGILLYNNGEKYEVRTTLDWWDNFINRRSNSSILRHIILLFLLFFPPFKRIKQTVPLSFSQLASLSWSYNLIILFIWLYLDGNLHFLFLFSFLYYLFFHPLGSMESKLCQRSRVPDIRWWGQVRRQLVARQEGRCWRAVLH